MEKVMLHGTDDLRYRAISRFGRETHDAWATLQEETETTEGERLLVERVDLNALVSDRTGLKDSILKAGRSFTPS